MYEGMSSDTVGFLSTMGKDAVILYQYLNIL